MEISEHDAWYNLKNSNMNLTCLNVDSLRGLHFALLAGTSSYVVVNVLGVRTGPGNLGKSWQNKRKAGSLGK